jgi:hypothetical protein
MRRRDPYLHPGVRRFAHLCDPMIVVEAFAEVSHGLGAATFPGQTDHAQEHPQRQLAALTHRDLHHRVAKHGLGVHKQAVHVEYDAVNPARQHQTNASAPYPWKYSSAVRSAWSTAASARAATTGFAR